MNPVSSGAPVREPAYVNCEPCCDYLRYLPARRTWVRKIRGGIVYECFSCHATWFVAKKNLSAGARYCMYPDVRRAIDRARLSVSPVGTSIVDVKASKEGSE